VIAADFLALALEPCVTSEKGSSAQRPVRKVNQQKQAGGEEAAGQGDHW